MKKTLETEVETYQLHDLIFKTVEEDLENVLTMVRLHGYVAQKFGVITIHRENNPEEMSSVNALVCKPQNYQKTEGYLQEAICQVLIKQEVLEQKQLGYALYLGFNETIHRREPIK